MIAALRCRWMASSKDQGRKGQGGSWASAIELIPDVDMFVPGARMYLDDGEYLESNPRPS